MAIERWRSRVRWLLCVLALGTLAAGCQAGRDPRDEALRKAAATTPEAGRTVLAYDYLEDQMAWFYYDRQGIHCWGMGTAIIDEPVWVLSRTGFTGSDGVVCLAIRDPDLQAGTARLVLGFHDGTTVSVPTDGKGAFIVPVPSGRHHYESTIFYDRDYNVLFEHRCPDPEMSFVVC
ncbi:MAG TPA: hypothetical protein VD886_03015 [Herpetosiphonaceae bacterium]|nr:hypothetical protein [Herpetosiphonaceae bacterium]